ncbi:hypothetical protein PPACK8108_LOCUS13917 [Phakopsora pachyrhizi]|uniref:Uncharacterized protein n=1 Tax=Phakopsora pachyrhizi TaxID=170000 RepID=A0AAV0B7F0_PHAPC|nr:hypothetical protein PPACK8108_LOCUS13917 [Phakopsora pachyrhizi]
MKLEFLNYFKQAYGSWKWELFQYQTIQSALDNDSGKSDIFGSKKKPRLYPAPLPIHQNNLHQSFIRFFNGLQPKPLYTSPYKTTIATQYLVSKPD